MRFSTATLTTLLFAVLAYGDQPVAPTTGTPETVTGALGDAQEDLNNPTAKTYSADFSNTKLKGAIKFQTSNEKDQPIQVSVNLWGFPSIGGPFAYHIHEQPVPADGNCTGTLEHLDPYIRGVAIPCDPSRPQSCQVGDLSGKYGKIPATTSNATYTKTYSDPYITLEQGKGAFIGGRSVVIHLANSTRYACANITELIKVPYGPTNSTTSAGTHHTPGYFGYAAAVAVGLSYLLI